MPTDRAAAPGPEPTTTALPDPTTTTLPDPTTTTLPDPTTTTLPDPTTTVTEPSTTTDSPSTTGAATATTAAPASTTTPPADVPETIRSGGFVASIHEIGPDIATRMHSSWRPGCPVPLEDLRYIELNHWDFHGDVDTGELVVHRDHAETIVTVFEQLFEAGFPIERMELVDVYGADDDASMAANNTSAFNCREVAWRPGVWSNHAFGSAIDINPLVNPYVSTDRILPPEGAAYADRSVQHIGGIYPGDVVVDAFTALGWEWGGTWSSAKDWQHFSASGR